MSLRHFFSLLAYPVNLRRHTGSRGGAGYVHHCRLPAPNAKGLKYIWWVLAKVYTIHSIQGAWDHKILT